MEPRYSDHFNDRLGTDSCVRYDIDPKAESTFLAMLMMIVETLTVAAASQEDPQGWLCGKRTDLCRYFERLYATPEQRVDLQNALGALDLATGQAWARFMK